MVGRTVGCFCRNSDKWCTNMHQPDLQMLAKIADLIGCEKRELITE